MLSPRVFSVLLVAFGVLVIGEDYGSSPPQQVTFEDLKSYIQPIIYQKLLRKPGDSEVIQQAKVVVSEYLVDSIVESARSPLQGQEEPIRSPKQGASTNGTNIGSIAAAVTLPPTIAQFLPPLPGSNMSRPNPAHVISQVDQIIQNVNGGNITGIVDQALRIRAPAPVQQLVNSIMNLVLCNPLNRLWNQCYGGGGLFGGRRR